MQGVSLEKTRTVCLLRTTAYHVGGKYALYSE